MWLLLLFILLNVAFAFFGRHLVHFSAFEITPAAVPILVWHGYNPLIAALFLCAAFASTSWRDARFLWLALPLSILVGYLALIVPNIYVLLVLWHLVGGTINYVLGFVDFKYVMFVLVNVSLNIAVARVYGLFV